MIWFDFSIPKDVLFFYPILKQLERRGIPYLVTARGGDNYNELRELLELYQIKYTLLGTFGGKSLEGKLRASIERQKLLLEFIREKGIDRLVNLCSVDAVRVTFGLGIPVITFYDMPLRGHDTDIRKALPQVRLTIPLSTKVFHPYLVPKEIYKNLGLSDEQIFTYNFYDPYIWLYNFKPDRKYYASFLKEYGLDSLKPTIIVREEEYKASYVEKKYPYLYKALKEIIKQENVNVIIIPRYEADFLKKEFPEAVVLEKRIKLQHILAFSDLFIGGGGTINAEATFFGTPVISTRSFISHYDKALIDAGLMFHAKNAKEILKWFEKLLGKRFEKEAQNFWGSMSINWDWLINSMID